MQPATISTSPRILLTGNVPAVQLISWESQLANRRTQTLDPQQLYSFLDVVLRVFKRIQTVLNLRLIPSISGVTCIDMTPPSPVTVFTITASHAKLYLDCQPHHVEQDSQLVTPLIFCLLARDWFGSALTFAVEHVPENVWLRAFYLYLDATGLAFSFDDFGQPVRPVPELHTLPLLAQDPGQAKFAPALSINPAEPGTAARIDYLLDCLGLTPGVGEPDNPPYVVSDPNFLIKSILSLTYPPPLMPPTHMPKPTPQHFTAPSADALAEAESPSASLTAEFVHSDYEYVHAHLQCCPVLILASKEGGNGKSTMLKQAAEQLVQVQQIVFISGVYVNGLLHPSIEHAYRNGGIVVLDHPAMIGESLEFVSTILADNPILGLQYVERPERHAEFRLVLETEYEKLMNVYEYTNSIHLLGYLVLSDSCAQLQNNLLVKELTTKTLVQAFIGVIDMLPENHRDSLHLISGLAQAPNRHAYLRNVLRGRRVLNETENTAGEKALAVFAAAAAKGKGKTKTKSTQVEVSEQASIEEQQQNLQALASSIPTVIPDLEPDNEQQVQAALTPPLAPGQEPTEPAYDF